MILALATSGTGGAIGLRRPGGAWTKHENLTLVRRGRGLVASIDALLTDADTDRSALSGVVVDLGPGSFTGVRIGVTCAKTLAFALGIPVAGASSLDVLAHAASCPEPVTAIRDAGRHTLYVASYADAASGRTPRVEPTRLPTEAVRERFGETMFVGDEAAHLCEVHLLGRGLDVAMSLEHLYALASPGLSQPTPAHALAPCYLQASAPERLRQGEP